MGCNHSKSTNPNGGDVLPPRIRPLLRQRIEEFRRRRNARGGEDGALSKKQLLKDVDNDYDRNSYNPSTDLANEISKENQTAIEKLSQVVPLPVSECGIERHDQDEDEDEDEEDKSRLIGPRSPSFKIYCIENEEKIEEVLCDTHEDDEETNQNNALQNKSLSIDSDASAASGNTANSNEVINYRVMLYMLSNDR